MIDFLMVSTRSTKKGVIEIYPKFIIKKSSDLMIRGGDFYAIWLENRGLWSTDEQDAIHLIDYELDKYAKENASKFDGMVKILHMWDAETGMIDKWHKYCQKQMRDNYTMLDEKLIFSNSPSNKEDYASKRLPYPLEKGSIKSYDRLISTLYTPEERHKIEWSIGAIVTGDSKHIQKFLVFYGAAGTGKSTILNIIQQLFEGYHSVFDAKALGSSSNSFALEAFKTNPLVAIQHDGDLSRIEDNTRINSLVSHELMTVNEKFKSTYSSRFKAFLYMGTNKPVKITDGRSGLIRRLIDVSPSGNTLDSKEYDNVVKKVKFELGAIAWHCKDVYLDNPKAYDHYIPINMMGASNDFYNFIEDNYSQFKEEDSVTLSRAWEMYKTYCDDAKVPYPFTKRVFKEELKTYFDSFEERHIAADGSRIRSYYSKFRTDRVDGVSELKKSPVGNFSETKWLQFDNYPFSLFDSDASEYIAQYATDEGTPKNKWEKVKTKLNDIDTSKLHYVRVPENHIVIDFDIPDENGNKCYALNLEAANKWPATYAELSKSGEGIHLHYIYTGDVSKLSRVYDDHVEIKVFTGNSSLRRKLTKCNDLPVSTISSGLPLKGDKSMINFEGVKTEKGLRTLIKRNLNKEIHPGTKPSVDFIYKILEDAYTEGLNYDVTDMRPAIQAFAMNSTNQAAYCVKLVGKMKFKSEDASDNVKNDNAPIVFYDVEVFSNLFVICYKVQGEDKNIVRLINPKPSEVEPLLKCRLVGFNCRRYDNHILYARLMGYTNEELYSLSQKIISGSKNCFFSEAYNISYTDIYDYAAKKQSLKKWEIELGIHHKELGMPWDKPVPEDKWELVAAYCDNDVIATEATFNATQADFIAREVLSDVAGLSVNDTTNTLTTKIIFGTERKPQSQFNYRDIGMVSSDDYIPDGFDDYTRFDRNRQPVFPGYEFDHGKSTYRGEEVGEGGYVYAEPGIHCNVALLDIASMHPSSIIAEQLFGPYTQRFQDIRDARIAIKHGNFDKARTMLGGALAKYLKDESSAKQLAQALKIAINSVYGLTAARFNHPFKDPRNKDNIVAKRGALFMVNLKHEVQKRGFTVAHIKTDSIKIPNATPEIIQFVTDYGKMYGYDFEHEATYDRMCLVNDAVYIARYDDGHWSATGAQFAVPYVFKTLFSKEPIVFDDMCETKSVSKGDLYLDMNEGLAEDEHNYIFVGRVGRFTPIKPDCGGGVLYRCADDKYHAATGTKGFRWLESEMVKTLGKEECIDKSYYKQLVDNAADVINQYGSVDLFVSDGKYYGPDVYF